MKKVRHLIGTVGAAPVLGLMMPVAAGAATAPKASSGTAKAVRSAASSPASPSPDAGCTGHVSTGAHSGNFSVTVFHTPQTNCVGGVQGFIPDSNTRGLLMRTRAYSESPDGTWRRWFSGHVKGTIHCDISGRCSYISWYQGIHQVRQPREQVCVAIVHASTDQKIAHGPVCITFG